MIRILFFAQLREQLGCAEYILPDLVATVAELKVRLLEEHPHWQPYFDQVNLLVAVNQAYAKAHTGIKSGDEVAFFPPVTGG